MFTISNLFQKKPVDVSLDQNTLAKTLSLYDLFAYGVSATVGSGIYLTIGEVARTTSGPSVVLSVFFAGLCALTSGLCFLELASKIPSAGSGNAVCWFSSEDY
jgi:cationic amino acid transporter 2